MESFVDRETELARLQKLYESSAAELAVIFGRRRLGKTALVKESLKEYDTAILYQAREKTTKLQLQQFIEIAAKSYPGVDRIRHDWESVLGYLAEKDAIIVLDEFPYLVSQDSSLPSIIQALFDYEFDDSAATIVLVGSSISMMEEAALLGNSPLYGRSSLKLDIQQLPFDAAATFHSPTATASDLVSAWSVFGGVPYYLENCSPNRTLGDNIRHTVLSTHGSLHNEPEYVLRMELTEPVRYFSILEAISGGNTRRNEISGATGIAYNQLSKYVNRLSRLRLLTQSVPVTEQKDRSKRSQFQIQDHFFRFWFRFIYGTGDRYDDFGEGAYEKLIAPHMSDFTSTAFEELSQRALRSLYPSHTITDVGGWWYQEHEIDVVGLTSEETLIVGECKFQNAPLSYDAFGGLKTHTEALRWTPSTGKERSVEYALFSRSGFTTSVTEIAAERDNVSLFTVDDVVDALSSTES